MLWVQLMQTCFPLANKRLGTQLRCFYNMSSAKLMGIWLGRAEQLGTHRVCKHVCGTASACETPALHSCLPPWAGAVIDAVKCSWHSQCLQACLWHSFCALICYTAQLLATMDICYRFSWHLRRLQACLRHSFCAWICCIAQLLATMGRCCNRSCEGLLGNHCVCKHVSGTASAREFAALHSCLPPWADAVIYAVKFTWHLRCLRACLWHSFCA